MLLASTGSLNFWERKVPKKSCSNFSALSTPDISNFLPFCFTPSTIHPPEVLANALTVSHIFLGSSLLASLASKSSHSMSLILSISSSFVIIMMIKLKYRISSSLHFKK